MGASRQAAHRRLGLLHREGYLLRERLFHGEGRVYHVSAMGQEASGDGLSRLEMISPATYRHNRMLVDLGPGGHRQDRRASSRRERRLRQERAIDGLGHDGHVPDGLLQVKGKKPIAIELELTAKSRRRLEAIVDDYLRSDLGRGLVFRRRRTDPAKAAVGDRGLPHVQDPSPWRHRHERRRQRSKDDEQLMAVMAVLWLLGSMAMLGPVGLAAAFDRLCRCDAVRPGADRRHADRRPPAQGSGFSSSGAVMAG